DVTKTITARYIVDTGLQYRFWKDRLTFGIACRNLFASHVRGTEFLGKTVMDFDNTFNYRQFRLTLAYNWGARLRQNRRQYQSDEGKERVVNDF
ncbi:MAG: outer membrane beta-barrel protein, partial [Aeriscardovia sp.]|nr:outer membrane beta-barrel protein [Aeriscardovia sp.]